MTSSIPKNIRDLCIAYFKLHADPDKSEDIVHSVDLQSVSRFSVSGAYRGDISWMQNQLFEYKSVNDALKNNRVLLLTFSQQRFAIAVPDEEWDQVKPDEHTKLIYSQIVCSPGMSVVGASIGKFNLLLSHPKEEHAPNLLDTILMDHGQKLQLGIVLKSWPDWSLEKEQKIFQVLEKHRDSQSVWLDLNNYESDNPQRHFIYNYKQLPLPEWLQAACQNKTNDEGKSS